MWSLSDPLSKWEALMNPADSSLAAERFYALRSLASLSERGLTGEPERMLRERGHPLLFAGTSPLAR
jgi:hypothetical protein